MAARFKLVRKTANQLKTTFHVTNSAGDVLGSINVRNHEVDDLLRCWVGPTDSSPQPKASVSTTPANKQGRMVATMLPSCSEAGAGKSPRNSARLLNLPGQMQDCGVAGMIRTAGWCDDRLGVEVLSIGRSATGPEDCALELCGSQLLVRITIQGSWIWVSACSLDQGEAPEPLFNVGDGPDGWTTVRRFVMALERSGVASLRDRPVQLGEPGSPDAWIIA
jgi:hypothetical protein